MKCIALEQAAQLIDQLARMAGRLGLENLHDYLSARYLDLYLDAFDAGCEWAQHDLPEN